MSPLHPFPKTDTGELDFNSFIQLPSQTQEKSIIWLRIHDRENYPQFLVFYKQFKKNKKLNELYHQKNVQMNGPTGYDLVIDLIFWVIRKLFHSLRFHWFKSNN